MRLPGVNRIALQPRVGWVLSRTWWSPPLARSWGSSLPPIRPKSWVETKLPGETTYQSSNGGEIGTRLDLRPETRKVDLQVGYMNWFRSCTLVKVKMVMPKGRLCKGSENKKPICRDCAIYMGHIMQGTAQVFMGHIMYTLSWMPFNTVYGRNPKQPPELVWNPVKSCKIIGLNYHINWWSPDFFKSFKFRGLTILAECQLKACDPGRADSWCWEMYSFHFFWGAILIIIYFLVEMLWVFKCVFFWVVLCLRNGFNLYIYIYTIHIFVPLYRFLTGKSLILKAI